MNLRHHSRRAAAATGLLALGAVAMTAPAHADTPVDRPDTFTSAYTVMATPGAVIGPDGAPAPGKAGTSGTFTFMINSDDEIICYDITTKGVTPPYQSMAKTATHVHQTAAGKNGPPRISFPNPQGDGEERSSKGCLKGPFTTGLQAEGKDTGEGFSLKSIEDDGGAGFSADTHTSAYVPGAVRGQLTKIPVGGVDTGMGGTADQGGVPAAALGLGVGATAVFGAGVFLLRRRSVQG